MSDECFAKTQSLPFKNFLLVKKLTFLHSVMSIFVDFADLVALSLAQLVQNHSSTGPLKSNFRVLFFCRLHTDRLHLICSFEVEQSQNYLSSRPCSYWPNHAHFCVVFSEFRFCHRLSTFVSYAEGLDTGQGRLNLAAETAFSLFSLKKLVWVCVSCVAKGALWALF